MFNPRFLIVSLGNPAPYYDSLHSAGHLALTSVQQALGYSQPPFTTQKYGREACLASPGQPYTMVQSPTRMNVCGPWVAKTWRQMLDEHQLRPADLSLVVVHDDLEESLGAVRVRAWKASHRGHNGVKSILSSLKHTDYPGARWSRISVGIDRPESSHPPLVADYVLSKMTGHQKAVIRDQAGPKVLGCLRQMRDSWEEAFERAANMPA
ncbi:peptidyl-tRNA hydrolase [Whalleya microplaca]|nr:peptidyl-tRNA hydrolase [Whalleya microplaca]